uniref:Sushi domain-containing protein n=1 Tax=Chrysemys picta bellii TaxID=8478 RepID=A0A8C3IYQ7_CHRPI
MGEICNEQNIIKSFVDKPCDLPLIENGKIAQYYYSFKSYYFPMSKEKKLSYTCVAGYTTESGSQDARITCTATGWSPAPKCYSKSISLDFFVSCGHCNGFHQEGNLGCYPGFSKLKARNIILCQLPRSNQPTYFHVEKCSKPLLENGIFSDTKRILKLNETLMYECDEGYHTRGGNTIEKAVCRTYGWSLTPNCTSMLLSLCNPSAHQSWQQQESRGFKICCLILNLLLTVY